MPAPEIVTPAHMLAFIQHLNRLRLTRNLTPDDAHAWYQQIGRCTVEDFRAAGVELIRTWDRSKEWEVNFSHLAARLRAIRAQRAAEVPEPIPPAHLANDPRAELAWIRAARAAIGDGASTAVAELVACQATGTQPRQIEPAPRRTPAMTLQAP